MKDNRTSHNDISSDSSTAQHRAKYGGISVGITSAGILLMFSVCL